MLYSFLRARGVAVGADPDNRSRPRAFYQEQLEKGGTESGWSRWTDDASYGTLRRDAIWLVTN